MPHLAFTGRALLADKMGLGKTVQAGAACELLRRTMGIFKTCNVWTARALRAAGCPVTPSLSLGVESLMDRARTFGRVVPAVTRPYELNPFMVDPTYDMNQ